MEFHSERFANFQPMTEDDCVDVISAPRRNVKVKNEHIAPVRKLFGHFMRTGKCRCNKDNCDVSTVMSEVLVSRRFAGVGDNMLLQMIYNIMNRNKSFKCLDIV